MLIIRIDLLYMCLFEIFSLFSVTHLYLTNTKIEIEIISMSKKQQQKIILFVCMCI